MYIMPYFDTKIMTDKTDHRQKNLLNKTVEQVLPLVKFPNQEMWLCNRWRWRSVSVYAKSDRYIFAGW